MAADAWFCWRLLEGPTRRDRTVLAPRSAAPSRMRPQALRNLGNSRAAALVTALAGSLAFIGLTDGGRYAREAPPLIQEVDRLAELAGFGLHQVSVTGHRFTPDVAIFDVFNLIKVRSLLRFDSHAVRERIERLPWVETASITRVMPDQGREMLIDANGRELASAGGSHRDLPRVAGAGALAEAAGILALVGKYPELLGRLEVAARVGERRWTLRLKGGPEVHLPAGGVPEALARLMAVHAQGRLLEHPYMMIDMRSDERIAVRPAFSDDLGRFAEPRGEQAAP
jgi:cell division protein FtsQ